MDEEYLNKNNIPSSFSELENFLKDLEEKAVSKGLKYEGRLAATLSDVCAINELDKSSDKQKKCYMNSIYSLLDSWGKLDRDKTNYIRSGLLEVGLTWLPVTDKAQKEIKIQRGILDAEDKLRAETPA